MKRIFLLLSLITVLKSNSQQYKVLHNFNDTTGGSPWGNLVSDGTYLYGTANSGGLYGNGVFFRIKPDGTGYDTLLNFTGGSDGKGPWGSFVNDGTYFYGCTQGGAGSYGTMYKIKPDGTGFTSLMYFPTSGSLSAPNGYLLDGGDGYLYGVSYDTPTFNQHGTIMKIKPDGSNFTALYSFTGTNGPLGAKPYGGMVCDGTYLYGITSEGGTSNLGVIFKIKMDGTNFSVLYNFSGTDGRHPECGLIYDGTYLYGTTRDGGNNAVDQYGNITGFGSLFKIKTDGSGFTNLYYFNVPDGVGPEGNLLLDGGYLYGETHFGGAHSYGSVYKVRTDGTGYSTLFSFNAANGGDPEWNSLIADSTYLYGMTLFYGAFNKGVIYKLNKFCKDTIINNPQTICGGNNYNINNHTYNISGTYYDTIRTPLGCDSIIITQLVVDPTYTVNNPQSICNGQVYQFNGHNYSAAGTYYDTLTPSIGCGDSIIITQITITNLVAQINAASQTSGCSPYQVILFSPTTADSYKWYFNTVNVGGNSSAVSSMMTNTTSVVQYDTVSLAVSTLAGCTDSISIPNYISVYPSPSVQYVFVQDTAPHTWDVYPNVSGGIPPYTYSWDWGDGTVDSVLYTSHTYTAAGNYVLCLNVTDASGCLGQYCEYDSLYRTSNSGNVVYINVINNPNSVRQFSGKGKQLKVYPNPASASMQITGLDTGEEIKIYNAVGKEIRPSITSRKEYTATLDVSALLEGIYFIQIKSGSQKFIVQH
ncbi:MAG: choice-of-anchor tandem repeat GloVer-containing protein [Bacteroidia bacterium]